MTSGGNSNGNPCVFPFTYKNTQWTGCVDDNTGIWCSTTENYDSNGRWGICPSNAPVIQDPTTNGKKN